MKSTKTRVPDLPRAQKPRNRVVIEIYRCVNGKESRVVMTWPAGCPIRISAGPGARKAA